MSDGRVVWTSGNHPASYSTPIPIEWHGHKLVVTLLENTLAAFDRRTGELWWELELSHGYDEHSAAPVYREPYLLIAAPFKDIHVAQDCSQCAVVKRPMRRNALRLLRPTDLRRVLRGLRLPSIGSHSHNQEKNAGTPALPPS